jgi:hypothetical protein
MPKVFCLDTNLDDTLAFIGELRNRLFMNIPNFRVKNLKMKRGAILRDYFDFKSLEYISPTAALVLASIYDRLNYATGMKCYTIDEDRWSRSVYDVLASIGFHDLLHMKPPFETKQVPNIIIHKFVSGEEVQNAKLGALNAALMELLPADAKEVMEFIEPYGGMIEASLNSKNWAYPPNHQWDFPPLRRWWMTGAIDVLERSLTLVVYDQGVSIPASLPNWVHWPEVLRKFSRITSRLPFLKENDALSLRLAMKTARTSTALPQHGKGLATMVEVASRAKVGRLRILSRSGEYIWMTGTRPVSNTLKVPIEGTLIEWKLKV